MALAVDVRAGFIAAIITLAVDARADFAVPIVILKLLILLASLHCIIAIATDVRGESCVHFPVCALICLCYH